MTVYGLQVEVSVGSETGPDAMHTLAVAFERGGEAVADFGRWVFPRLTPVFEEAEVEQFDAEGNGPIAGTWAELTEGYAAWKERRAPGLPILELHSHLRAGLTESSSSFAHREWSASEFSFGTNGVFYASYHQGGTTRMVPRPVFDFGPTFERLLQREAMAGLRDAISGSSAGLLELEGDS